MLATREEIENARENLAPAGSQLPRHKRGAGYRYKREELDQWLLLG